ncbi:hypothetical protein GCM10023085_01250 [Actinomadura viridis]|uniref:Transposase-like protein n=1 Tax=Actinomadura viridis TaxID=58110 RepID=A0A931DPI8_9ACTN|nr:transposase-like protein [Actinomadura viridis]
MSERAAPFYCPYCGEEHLEPREAPAAEAGSGGATPRRQEGATWFCRDCVRSFTLKFLGVGAPHTKENSR